MILRVDSRRRRVYFGSRLHSIRVHHGAVGVACVVAGHRVVPDHAFVGTVLIFTGGVLMWDDLPDLRRSWWLRDV